MGVFRLTYQMKDKVTNWGRRVRELRGLGVHGVPEDRTRN
jgi:hypothetical protein